MTLFEEFIYWTDWETKSINRAHKTLGLNKTVLISTLHRPMDIHIYHPYRQPEGKNNVIRHSQTHANTHLSPLNSIYVHFLRQWLTTRVRSTTEAAVTCVCCRLEEATSAPAPLTFIWQLTANSACLTALQVRWASLRCSYFRRLTAALEKLKKNKTNISCALFSLSAKMTSAFHFGGSVTLRMTVGIVQMSPQTAVSDNCSLTATRARVHT